ncbi:unnamed protein product [Calypogeia fissa]
MWRVAVRQLMYRHQLPSDLGKRARLGSHGEGIWSNNGRLKSSVAAATLPVTEGSSRELVGVDVGWELRAASALPLAVTSSLPCSVLNPIEGSVTALDEALHSAVQLPWLANPTWWMQLVSDSKADRAEHFGSIRSFGSSAAAAEIATEEEEEVRNNDEEIEHEPSKEKTRKKHKYGQSVSQLRERQIKIESLAWQTAAEEYRELLSEMCKKNLAPNLPYVQSLVLGWFEPLKKAIEAEQLAIKNLEFKVHRAGYGPYLSLLPADMLAVITMHKLLGMLMTDLNQGGCVKVVGAASVIGEAVETEVGIYKFLNKKEKKRKKKKKKTDKDVDEIDENVDEEEAAAKVSESALAATGKLQNKVKTLLKQRHLRMASKVVLHANGDEPWSKEIRAKVGSVLIQLFLDNAFLQTPASQAGDEHSELRPAFKHYMKSMPAEGGFRQFGVIECDSLILEQLNYSVRYMVLPYMPMLVKPLSWRRFGSGGYLVLPSSVMRIHGSRQQKDAIEKTPYSDLKNVFEALDTLGSVRWRINTRVLDVVENIWADGGRIAEMVDVKDVPIPEKPETTDEVVLRNWKFEAARAKRTNSERHSLRCDTELKLNVARKLHEETAFYYPHNLDFRGRAYPLHPHLNHLGSDMCRGILEFAAGRPLGPTGFRWLKIHLANVFAGGVDKLSFDGRVAFVDSNLEEIFDSAENPLGGRRWWLKAEDPFQCLAACMDIRDAVMSGKPETFESYLPIHQDGSCNGLQHYAALGRDKTGAESVNLIAGERPADVYTGIAMRVRDVIEKDAADDPSVNPNVDKAKLLINQIDRKLVKQTVMTSVYGVTFIGARNQIMSRLKERGLGDEVVMFRAACYAAKITIEALGQTFKEARCIMGWLGDCAKIIASEGEPVRWITPMGLPVVQPYRKPGRKMVKTSLQVLALRELGNQPVAVSRQRTAFPPNFVHSLDGSHMMMTALACKRAHLYFAGVHDSFWTHAGTVDKLNSLLRKTFVELYSDPILENLLKGFKEQFPKLDFPDVPSRGDLDLSEVTKAPYFFN